MKKVLKFLKWTGIVLLALILLGVGYAFLGLAQTQKLEIKPVNLSLTSDGTFSGEYDLYRWTTRVEVTLKDQRIIAVRPLNVSTAIQNSVNVLTDRVIKAQTPVVDAISGATASSHAFLKAVETALENAGGTVN